MCYGLNKYCNNISIKSSYFFCILKQNPFIRKHPFYRSEVFQDL